MLGKLSKEEQAKVQVEFQAATDTHAAMITAIEEFNGQVAHLFDSVQAAIDAHNAAVEALSSTLIDIGADQRSEFDEKSEKWQESERAGAILEWLEKYEEAEFEEVSIEVPQIPEDEISDDFTSELDIPSSFEE